MIFSMLTLLVAETFNALQAVFGSTQLVGSTHLAKTSAGDFYQRCLPASSVSTIGLLHFLCKWGLVGSTFNQKSHAKGSFELLETLCSVTWQTDKCNAIVVYGDEDGSCRWPRPLPMSSKVELRICMGGICDLGALHKAAHGPPCAGQVVFKKWCDALGSGKVRWSWKLPFMDLLSLCHHRVVFVWL